jgi:uncharacterized membrane protein YhdT
MGREARSGARWALAFCLAGLAGMALVTAMLALQLEGGVRGAVLWILIAIVTAGLFTAILEGPSALVRLVRGHRPS